VALEDPDFDALTREEWDIVDEAITANWHKSGNQMSDESHLLGSWSVAYRRGEGTTIPYEAVRWSSRNKVTPTMQEHALELANEFGLARE